MNKGVHARAHTLTHTLAHRLHHLSSETHTQFISALPWKFKKLAISVTSSFPSSSLFPLSFFFHLSLSTYPFVSVWARKAVMQRDWLIITEYTKLGEKKKTISLSFDVRHERNQNYKETEHYKEERKLAHSFFNPLLLFFAFFSFAFFSVSVFPFRVLSLQSGRFDYGKWLITSNADFVNACVRAMTIVFSVDTVCFHRCTCNTVVCSQCYLLCFHGCVNGPYPSSIATHTLAHTWLSRFVKHR